MNVSHQGELIFHWLHRELNAKCSRPPPFHFAVGTSCFQPKTILLSKSFHPNAPQLALQHFISTSICLPEVSPQAAHVVAHAVARSALAPAPRQATLISKGLVQRRANNLAAQDDPAGYSKKNRPRHLLSLQRRSRRRKPAHREVVM